VYPLAVTLGLKSYGLNVANIVNQTKVRIIDLWLAKVLTGFNVVEFFNGHNTDKAHPFIEDCIAKQQPLVKVTVDGVSYVIVSIIYPAAVSHCRLI